MSNYLDYSVFTRLYAKDLINALKKLGIKFSMRYDYPNLIIKLYEDRFITIKAETQNIFCYIKDIKMLHSDDYLDECWIKLDNIYTNGDYYFKTDTKIVCGVCGETDLTELIPDALESIIGMINFYKKSDTWTCDYCGNMNRDFDMQCPKCGAARR